MSARKRRGEVARSEIERLVELDRGGRPTRTGEGSARPAQPLAVDDVRAPLNESPQPLRIRRRDLLAWTGAAALLPACEGIARAQTRSDQPQPMSVGFVAGSEAWRSLRIAAPALNRGIRPEAGRPAEPAKVVPATSLIAGDQTLANQLVRVRIHGLYPIPNPTDILNAYATVYFPTDDPSLRRAPLPFIAWGYHSRPAPDPAPPTRFVAPLGPDGALDLLLEVTPLPREKMTRRPSLLPSAPGPVGGRFTTRFTVDWFAGRPKLQRGIYLLGLAPDTWSTERDLPMPKAGQPRPVELLSLMVSFEPIPVER